MRKGIKVLSVLMLMCVMFSLTACGAAKIVGTWAQKAEQPGTPNQLQNDFGEIQFNKDGTYDVKPIIIHPDRKRLLNENLLMFFTGFTRFSSEMQTVL